MSRRPFRPIAPEVDHAALAAALEEVYAPAAPKEGPTATEERWLSGYEEIAEWVVEQGRVPEDREGADVFERLLAVRLNQLRADAAACAFLRESDKQGLLGESSNLEAASAWSEKTAAGALVQAEEVSLDDPNSIRVLRHVSAPEVRREPEHIAQREPCADFALYERFFKQVEQELKTGAKLARALASDLSVARGDVFSLGGQLAYVAHVGEEFREPNDRLNARLLVVYSNGTQSNLLRRSLQKALLVDPASRRVQAAHDDPLFEYANAQNAGGNNTPIASSHEDEQAGKPHDDAEPRLIKSGMLYVLRSLSTHPFVAEHREFLHKIGVTGGDVKRRLAKAEESPTFLFAPVEVVASYRLENIARHKIETLVHQFLAEARVVISTTDRFGKPVEAKEWFHVPLHVIDEVVQRIQDGSIMDFVYDATAARLVSANGRARMRS